MSIAGRPIEMEVEVPEGPTQPRQLLPLLQWLADEVGDIAAAQVAQQGKTISCRAGCGACCRQLVPISQAEAYRIADLVERLPEPRRTEVRGRFRATAERLAAAGLLDQLVDLPDDPFHAIWTEYFRLGIPCPFLEEESCSIHPDRPLVCREYLVMSPAENCRQAAGAKIDLVLPPIKVAYALLQLERGAADSPGTGVPLSLAPQWAASHREPPPRQTGPELLNEVFQYITERESPPLKELDDAHDAANPIQESAQTGMRASANERPQEV
jgi:Fe-S-cluster containining protein